MTEMEYDFHQCLEFTWTEDDVEVNYALSAKNLSKMGYQKIVWHNAKKELPERLKYVLGYDYYGQTYSVVSWDGTEWTDNNGFCYNTDYWTDLPQIKIEEADNSEQFL